MKHFKNLDMYQVICVNLVYEKCRNQLVGKTWAISFKVMGLEKKCRKEEN
jgi:hypothetical protein